MRRSSSSDKGESLSDRVRREHDERNKPKPSNKIDTQESGSSSSSGGSGGSGSSEKRSEHSPSSSGSDGGHSSGGGKSEGSRHGSNDRPSAGGEHKSKGQDGSGSKGDHHGGEPRAPGAEHPRGQGERPSPSHGDRPSLGGHGDRPAPKPSDSHSGQQTPKPSDGRGTDRPNQPHNPSDKPHAQPIPNAKIGDKPHVQPLPNAKIGEKPEFRQLAAKAGEGQKAVGRYGEGAKPAPAIGRYDQASKPVPVADKSKNTVAANEKKFGARAADQKPNKGSTGYTDKQLKASPKESTRSSWQTERGKHTKGAEQSARKDIGAAKKDYKAQTGKDMKPPPGRAAKTDKVASQAPGKKVEHHHHAGVSESRKAGLSPKVAGEKGRTSAVASSKSDKVHGTVDGKRYTHHNVASKMDKAEQARTARAMGRKGEAPKLPKGDAGRRGMVDSSGTSKWRYPDTANQTERAKHDWTRKEPAGPKVDKKGNVAPDKTKGATKPETAKGQAPKGEAPQAPKAEAPPQGPKAEAPPTGPKVEAPKAPKVEAPKGPKVEAPKAPKGEPVPKGGKLEAPHGIKGGPGMLGKLGGLAGAAGEVLGIVNDVKTEVAHNHPEKLPEGAKVDLTRPGDVIPWMREPTGYSVEKTDGQVIYRNSEGQQVSRDEAMKASSKPASEQANWA